MPQWSSGEICSLRRHVAQHFRCLLWANPNPQTHMHNHHRRRVELLAGLQAVRADSAALLQQTFGPAARVDDGQTGYTVRLPSSPQYHGLHQVSANGERGG